jgi:predicted O-linked N-acetylglucosamine transferase (SPINDLY family)
MATLQEAFAMAVQYQNSGRLPEAEHLYRQILQVEPSHEETWRRLGTVCQALGRLGEAVAAYQQALALKPDCAEAYNDLGIALARENRLAVAARSLHEALNLRPDYREAANNLGIVQAMQGRFEDARASFLQALRLKPDFVEAHHNLGRALRDLGRLDEAATHLREAVRLKPDYVEAHHNLGMVLRDQGALGQAAACYQEALRLRPNNPQALTNLGAVLSDQGRLQEAVTCYQQALRLRPDLAAVRLNLGVVLKGLGRFDEAAASFHEALRLEPQSADGYNGLGNVFLEQGRHDEAEQCFQRALREKPGFPEAYNNLGNAFADQGKLDEALACYREALRLKPTYASAHSNLLLHLNYVPDADPEAVFAEHRRWESLHGYAGGRPDHPNNRDPERRLRIGYVTPDLHRHPVARFFVEPILAYHNAEEVEAICYAEVPTALAARVQALASHWRAVRGLTDVQLADQVRADGIDILVDLAGHTVNNRLLTFSYKPAPVQISFLGYPNTTGLTTVDYRLTDAIADPPGEVSRHTEELIRLPGAFCCYAPPTAAPAVSPPPARQVGHVTFGSPHHLAKLNAKVLELWCTILHMAPHAHLLIFRHTLKGRVREDLRRQFERRGIGSDRVELREAVDMERGYLGWYGSVDLILDAFPWSSHTTACDSLWMGVPLLTFAGANHAGRMAASVLTRLGLTELVADSAEKYLSAAVRLAGDVERLTEMRHRLRDLMRQSPLCDERTYTRALEDAYRALWRRWCAR